MFHENALSLAEAGRAPIARKTDHRRSGVLVAI
jgi:hypothetical protein